MVAPADTAGLVDAAVLIVAMKAAKPRSASKSDESRISGERGLVMLSWTN